MEDTPGSSTTFELAGIGSRFIALLIDDIILLVISFIVGLFLLPFLTDFTSLLIGVGLNAVYYWYFWTRNQGQTPGKRAVNIRVIKADGTPFSDADALLRVFGYYVSRISLGLGYLWAVFDANNQAWHDKMANTYVVVADPNQPRRTIQI
jgi:uncharacterized RDD family membrane protein YckC